MIIFFGCKRMDCKREKVRTAVVTVILSMAVVCLFSVGCKKRVKPPEKAPVVLESVYTNRSNNAAYIESIMQLRSTQLSKATAYRVAFAEMSAYSNRVMAALPAGTNAAALDSALAKDETWQKLKAKSDKAQQEDRQTVIEAREKVRQALLEEARAKEAVAQGKAKAIDQVKAK